MPTEPPPPPKYRHEQPKSQLEQDRLALLKWFRFATGAAGLPAEHERKLLEIVEFCTEVVLQDEPPEGDLALVSRLHDLLAFGSDTDRTTQAKYLRATAILAERLRVRDASPPERFAADFEREWVLDTLARLSDVDRPLGEASPEFLEALLRRTVPSGRRRGAIGIDRALAELVLACGAFGERATDKPDQDQLKRLQNKIAEGRRNAAARGAEDRAARYTSAESRAARWMGVAERHGVHDEEPEGD